MSAMVHRGKAGVYLEQPSSGWSSVFTCLALSLTLSACEGGGAGTSDAAASPLPKRDASRSDAGGAHPTVDGASEAPVGDAGAEVPTEPDPARQAAVPDTLGGDGECLQDEEGFANPPDLCEWVAVGDATVVATIEGFERLAEPGWGFPSDAPEGRLLGSEEECRPSTSALAIDIRVEDTWYGQTPLELRVRVGAGQVDHFIPHPTTVDPETGELEWYPVLNEALAHRAPLRLGQRIVLGISRVEVELEGATTEYWSLMGNTILGMDEEERIHVHRRTEDCDFNLAPKRLDGVPLVEAAELVEACSDELLQGGRELGERVRAVWGTPQNAVSALCSSVGPE